MSEYQYYEFLAVDRPLSADDQQALRAISSRARITSTSFTNHYEWGDLKADPTRLLQRYFDLHVYVAIWGSKRLLIRLPDAALNPADFDAFQLDECELLEVRQTPEGWLIDIDVEADEEAEWEEFDDGSGWMVALAGLRQELLSGDLRLFYLCWLWAVQVGYIREEALEPLPGIGPLTPSQQALAEFMALDPMLVEAAAESGEKAPAGSEVEGFVASLPLQEKDALLRRLLEGDGSVTAELQRRLRQYGQADQPPRCSVAELKLQANASHERHRQAYLEEKARREAEQAAAEEKQRRERMAQVARLGERAWQEAQSQIGRRQPKGYEMAAGLLADLRELAIERGEQTAFEERLDRIVAEHRRKGRFLEQLQRLGLLP
ncbi:hypothetical protein [Halomonas sp. LBP4]|uniref:hypothetical protein n=1 Tax=Halomonas sp. LBP4 TaxID=2044917 RepID=UPI000D76D8B3|nr:hypothetical protein [Halomonas sp. LBP4]PXX95126.1 hypothetical protein CR157_19790 [Halomonas sp. LBP4]